MSPNEIRERVAEVVSGRTRSYVNDAQYLAHVVTRLLLDYEQAVNNLSAVQSRCTELLVNQRTLRVSIQRIVDAKDEDRDQAVADALVTIGAIQ